MIFMDVDLLLLYNGSKWALVTVPALTRTTISCRGLLVRLICARTVRPRLSLCYSQRKYRTAANPKTSVYPARVRSVVTGGAWWNTA